MAWVFPESVALSAAFSVLACTDPGVIVRYSCG